MFYGLSLTNVIKKVPNAAISDCCQVSIAVDLHLVLAIIKRQSKNMG